MKLYKIKFLILALLTEFYSNNIFSMETFMGMTNLKDKNFDSLKIIGMSNLSNVIIKNNLEIIGATTFENNIKVNGKISIVGPVKINKSYINTGKIVGSLKAVESDFANELKVIGLVECSQCNFKSEIEIISNKSIFTNSELSTIKIMKNENDGSDDSSKENSTSVKKKQILILKGNTKVNGDVIFEDQNSELILDKNVKISGKIIKGNV
ncbi:MAG: hypothetical protein HQK51_05530 [Oligoflexia bacterium]|nr:hypothetical protein [Oligoflexia bacterium]